MPTSSSNLAALQDDLKRVQADVKQLDRDRERLSGEARVEEHKFQEAVEKLKALGIPDAEKMSPEALVSLRDKKQGELEDYLARAKREIVEAQRLLGEYDRLTNQAGSL